tara:strand:- start:204 stop:458 length:255 start_codon:yes stop_codon:yes gene_type:complete
MRDAFRPDRDRQGGAEVNVALDPEAKGQTDALQFPEAEATQFRKTQIRQTEEDVAICVEFGGEPGTLPNGIEELHDGNMVGIAL